MSFVGKPSPDVSCVVAANPATKTSLKKCFIKNKPTVVCFVSKTSSPVETNAAVQKMEEGKYQLKDKAVFVVISLDGTAKEAQTLNNEASIRNCTHLHSSTKGKEFGINRTPAFVVIGADGKVKMQSEEEVANFMAYV